MSAEGAAGDVVLVDRPEALKEAAARLRRASALGLDLEGGYNLHHYGIHLCLIQISDGRGITLIDPVAPGSVEALRPVLSSPRVTKVMCAAGEDVKLLKLSRGIAVRGLFDVQAAGKLLGMGQAGLGRLVERYLGRRLGKKDMQRSDWTRRPLSADQLEYAAAGVRPLIEIWRKQQAELAAAGRLALAAERNRAMEAREFRPDPQPHLRLRGAGGVADSEQGLLAALYEARERYARHLDLPPFRVIANDALVGLARRPPADRAGWAKALSPRARRFLEELLAAARRPEAAP